MKEFRKTEKNLFICEECDKLFHNKSRLACHIRCKHNGVKNYYDKWVKENDEGFCKICNKELNFKGFYFNYSDTCCKKHMFELNEIKKKQTCLNRYGVEYTLQTTEVKNKGKQTKKEKYGDEKYNNRNKQNQTKKERYGNENYNNSEKRIKTNIKKYGGRAPIQCDEVKCKVKTTMLNNHGVEHALQNKDIHIKQQKCGFKLKKYKNSDVYYRGLYELDFLEKYFNLYPDIINGPRITYFINNDKHYYFSDFLIPSLNTIVEIKNSYLFNKNKEIIMAKEKATIANGFNYIMILDENYINFAPGLELLHQKSQD
jgi:hypothetical protein